MTVHLSLMPREKNIMTTEALEILDIRESVDNRNDFLTLHKPFVAKLASKHCGRYLVWGRDEELSIGLIAMNQALDAYRPDMNVPFLAFARRVIERRLTDYFRKEKRNTHLPYICGESEDAFSPGEVTQAWEEYLATTLRMERTEEILAFSRLLNEYQVSFVDLEVSCPKHQDSRQLLTNCAYMLTKTPDLVQRFIRKKQVPIKDLAKICGLSPKTIEKSRKYIVATALLLYHQDEFLHLREFVQIPKERRS
jgi:RNA polymerase sigma factor